MKSIEKLLQACRARIVDFDEDKIISACNLVEEAHKDNIRRSGITVAEHCIETAIILMEYFQVDETSVLATLFHNIYDSGKEYNRDLICSGFGSDVADIVDVIYRIRTLEKDVVFADSTMDSKKIDNYRLLLLSLFSDIRILFIIISDFLQGLPTLSYLNEKKQQRIAKELLYIYTPFINRMGLHDIKWQFEDSAFQILNPEKYEEISSKLKASKEDRDKYIQELIQPIEKKLKEDSILQSLGIKWKIYGRAKHIFSIYNKMLNRGVPYEKLYDIFALRLVIDTDNPNLCHYIYGIVSSLYPTAPDTFKDYICAPKKNGYQSIHVGAVGKYNRVVEIQYRTEDMHIAAENGIAAHFRYKNNAVSQDSVLEQAEVDAWLTQIREVFENIENQSFDEVLDNVNKNLFMDDIFLLTPKNDYISMPRGSVPLDYAYKIHTEVGNKYIGAKVNSKVVPLDYILQSGDRCDIITSDNNRPQKEWLQYVITPRAKNYIAKAIKADETQAALKGEKIWKQALKDKGLSISKTENQMVAKGFNFQDMRGFYMAIAYQDIEVPKALHYVSYRLHHFLFEDSSKKTIQDSDTNIMNFDQATRTFSIKVAQKQPALNKLLLAVINNQRIIINHLEVNEILSMTEITITVKATSETTINTLITTIKKDINIISLNMQN